MTAENAVILSKGAQHRLTPEEAEFLQTSARLLHLPANRVIFRQGDLRKHFFLVADGNVRIFYHSTTGRKIEFCNCGPLDLFGLADLAASDWYSANAETSEASTVWSIPVREIPIIARRLPIFMLRIVRAMSMRLNTIAVLMESLVTVSLRTRVANFLLAAVGSFGPDQCATVSRGLTHEAMADILGCSRQTLTKILNEFARAGYIRIERKRVTVFKASGLERLRRSITIESSRP